MRPIQDGIFFNASSAKKELTTYIQDFVKSGGRKWLDATVRKIIPTWSKASRATFQKLARDLGTSIPYGPLRSQTDRESLGLANSAGSGFFVTSAGTHFVYTTQLRYLIYNEYNAAVAGPPPQPWSNNVRFTPYHFQDAGDKSWEAHAKTIKIPDPTKWMN